MHMSMLMNVKRIISIWNEEWESYVMMSRRIVSNFLLYCEPLSVVELMLPRIEGCTLTYVCDDVDLIDLEVTLH